MKQKVSEKFLCAYSLLKKLFSIALSAVKFKIQDGFHIITHPSTKTLKNYSYD